LIQLGRVLGERQGADAIDPEHDATELRYGRPCQALVGVKRFKPVLYVEGFDVVRYAVTPLGEKITADDLVSVEGRALGLWSERIGAYVMCEVMLQVKRYCLVGRASV